MLDRFWKTCRMVTPAALFVFSAAPLSHADRVVTTTGKVLEGKATKEDDFVLVDFGDDAVIEIPARFVAEIEIEGDMSSYVPKDDREKEMLEKGYVKYEGRWVTEQRYLLELDKKREEAMKKLEDIKEHLSWGNEWKKETKNFLFRSNASPEILDYYAELFEDFYGQYAKRFGIKVSNEFRKNKFEVCIFRDRDAFHKYTGRSPGVQGYFWPLDRALYLYHDYENPEATLNVLFHEGTHMINYLSNPDLFGTCPIWLEEGTSEYFGNVDVEQKNGKWVITPGSDSQYRIAESQEHLRCGEQVSLNELFTTEKSGFDSRYYSFAWSFVHFLANHPKYSKGFFKFYKNTYQGRGIRFRAGSQKEYHPDDIRDRLLADIRVKNLEELEQEWIEYIRNGLKLGGGYGYYLQALMSDFRGTPEDTTGTTTSCNAADPLAYLDKAFEAGFETSAAYFLRARIHVGNGKHKGAVKDLKKAMALNPTQAKLYVVRAWLYNVEGKQKDAEKNLRIAIALEPLNPDYPILLDSLLARNWDLFRF